MRWLALVLLAACAGEVESEPCPALPDAEAPEETPEQPAWGSVAWVLTQPYGEACDDGARAGDNPLTAFVEHPVSGRCAFACDGFEALCGQVQGRCDASGFCVSVLPGAGKLDAPGET